jgi:hypothetical protein
VAENNKEEFISRLIAKEFKEYKEEICNDCDRLPRGYCEDCDQCSDSYNMGSDDGYRNGLDSVEPELSNAQAKIRQTEERVKELEATILDKRLPSRQLLTRKTHEITQTIQETVEQNNN